MYFNVATFDVEKFDSIIARGLCSGVGSPDGQMCIEAAICNVLGMPHDDDPKCVAAAVRSYKIRLNDSNWSSPEARAKGLRDLGLAQLGSKGVIDDIAFSKRLAELTIRVLIPAIFRDVLAGDPACIAAADRCEAEGTAAAAHAAARAARAAHAARAADAARAAAHAARAADYSADAARAADYSADAAHAAHAAQDRPLILSAGLALQVLREMGSPGCALL